MIVHAMFQGQSGLTNETQLLSTQIFKHMLSFVWRNKKLENIHLPNFKKKTKQTKAEANSKQEEGRRKIELKSGRTATEPVPTSQKAKGTFSHHMETYLTIKSGRKVQPPPISHFSIYTELERREQSLHGLSG